MPLTLKQMHWAPSTTPPNHLVTNQLSTTPRKSENSPPDSPNLKVMRCSYTLHRHHPIYPKNSEGRPKLKSRCALSHGCRWLLGKFKVRVLMRKSVCAFIFWLWNLEESSTFPHSTVWSTRNPLGFHSLWNCPHTHFFTLLSLTDFSRP